MIWATGEYKEEREKIIFILDSCRCFQILNLDVQNEDKQQGQTLIPLLQFVRKTTWAEEIKEQLNLL